MFGVSVGYIGMSLTSGIVMGLCSIAGALISLATRFDSVEPASLPFVFAGLVLLAVAVVIVTVAGLKRDKLLAEAGEELQGIRMGDRVKMNSLHCMKHMEEFGGIIAMTSNYKEHPWVANLC